MAALCAQDKVGTTPLLHMGAHGSQYMEILGAASTCFCQNKIKPAYVLEHGDGRKLGPTTIFGQVVANGVQIWQALGLGGCHLLKTCFEIGLVACIACHLVEVADSLEDFCLIWLQGGSSNCVQSLLD